MAEIILPKELKPEEKIIFYVDGEKYQGHISNVCAIVLLDRYHNSQTIEKIFKSFGLSRDEICSSFNSNYGIWPIAPTYKDLYELLNKMKSRSSPTDPYVEYTELSKGSYIKFYLPYGKTYTGVIETLGDATYYVNILDGHYGKIVDKIFDAFKVSRTDINGICRESEIWPESSLEDLQKFIKSLSTNSKKQTNYVFELQDTRIDFKREENKGGNPVCSRIREAAISIKYLSNSEISC